MSHLDLQSQPRKKDDVLALSLDRLDQAIAMDFPGREREWAEEVGNALARVEAALRQHLASAKAPDGVLGEVDETRPTLSRQADQLRGDHDDFLAQVLALREEVRRTAEAFQPVAPSSSRTRGSGVADLGTIRQQAEQILAGLRENKHAETQLVLESVNTDLGVGD